MFSRSVKFRGQGLSNWSVDQVSDFALMFQHCDRFNANIGNWNVQSAETLQEMFHDSAAFQQNLCAWGPRLKASANVVDMFQNAFLCPAPGPGTPLLPEGPFCHACN